MASLGVLASFPKKIGGIVGYSDPGKCVNKVLDWYMGSDRAKKKI